MGIKHTITSDWILQIKAKYTQLDKNHNAGKRPMSWKNAPDSSMGRKGDKKINILWPSGQTITAINLAVMCDITTTDRMTAAIACEIFTGRD